MNTTTIITVKNTQVGNDTQHMTSLEIAEVAGKQHKDVLKAIRNMEPAWERIAASKFRLGSYKDANGQLRPCYSLTKTECLYIATKFNDEARARLVLRWETLERQQLERQQQLCLPEPQKILALADNIIGEGLRMLNEEAEDTLTATQIAKEMGMTAQELYRWLIALGILYWQSGRASMPTANWATPLRMQPNG